MLPKYVCSHINIANVHGFLGNHEGKKKIFNMFTRAENENHNTKNFWLAVKKQTT